MIRRLRPGAFLLALVFCAAPPIHAQTSSGCFTESAAAQGPNQIKVEIAAIEFEGEIPTDIDRLALAAKIQHLDITDASTGPVEDWVSWVEETVHLALQDKGYFKAIVEAKPHLVSAQPKKLVYIVTAEVNSGIQYRMGTLRITGATAFTEAELIKKSGLKSGDLFSVSDIRNAIEAIVRLYGSRGYVDATIEPKFPIGDDTHLIDFILDVSQEKLYRMGTISALGVDPSVTKAAHSLFETGQPFNSAAVDKLEKFAESSQHSLHVELHRNVPDGLIDVVLTPDVCPRN